MAARNNVDLDRIVDYKAEYTAVLSKEQLTISGDSLRGLCPFHDDTKPSFSADLKTGKWKCFSEGEGASGNFLHFWAMVHGYSRSDTARAYKEILEKYGVAQEAPRAARKAAGGPFRPYTIEDYSRDKKLPVAFLQEACRAKTGRDRDGTPFLRISYTDTDGQEVTYRKRYAGKTFLWRTDSKGKIHLYGEWRLEGFKQAGWVILVEGESDTQSLWYMGLPALGVAGADMFKTQQAGLLQGMKIYVHKEPDRGGETFTARVYKALRDAGFTGTVYRWDCAHLGAKDPSDVYIAHGQEEGGKLIREALAAAELIDIEKELLPEVIPGAPITLRQPEAWSYSEDGISSIDPKTMAPTCICRTPIILTQRLKNIETGGEKIEVAFKRDGQWHTAFYPRSTVFTSRKVTELADLGCTITSENAKQIVNFLGALETENIDLIPTSRAVSSFGWQPGGRFLPWYGDGLLLDVDPSLRRIVDAYRQSGTLENWIAHMDPHRARDKFRFILAASFAAPLLRIVKQRNFFVYNWGNSKGGKTAALLAALSAWGDPEKIRVSFNGTQVGVERMAALIGDLPLGIDERQLAGKKQEELTKIVYMVTDGKGKLRGAKNGGIQPTGEWRTVALATGEQPLSTYTTMTGVSTRVLEIYGGPFEDETEASLMYQQTAEDHGQAGPAFIERLLQMEEKDIVAAYERMRDYVRSVSGDNNGAHIAGVSLIALADTMIDRWFFGGDEASSWAAAKRMAANILTEQVEENATDVNETSLQYIVDWVISNKTRFERDEPLPRLGYMSKDGDTVYILPSMLQQELEEANIDYRKTMKYLVEQGLIETYVEPSSGKRRQQIRRRFGKDAIWVVAFHLREAAGGGFSEDADEPAAPEQWVQQEFREITDEDEGLPF